MTQNPNCDGNHCASSTGEVKLYPLGGGANLILCQSCFSYENAYHRRMAAYFNRPEDWPVMSWDFAEEYPDTND